MMTGNQQCFEPKLNDEEIIGENTDFETYPKVTMSEIFSIVKVGILFSVCVWISVWIYKFKFNFLAWAVFC